MIYLLYGGDDLSVDEALLSMKADVTPAELRDVNVTVLNGSVLRLDELSATCDTVPFLADRRMVIVEGLLGLFERGRPGVPTSRSPSRTLAAWDGLPDYLSGMPQTTHLAFKELQLSESNPLLTRLRPLAEVLKFPLPSRNELQPWIRQRAAKLGVEIEPRAVGTLAEAIGGDLRMIDQELQKLGLYCWGRTVLQVDVEQLVAHVREASIFAAVDAVVEGRPGMALDMIHQLLDAGRAPIFILTMIARQVRLILLAEDLRAQRVPASEMGKRLALSGYPLTKTLEQERRLTKAWMVEAHHKLVQADLAMKSTTIDESLVLELLVTELAHGRARR